MYIIASCDIHFVNWETHWYKVGKHSVRNVIVTTIMSSHVGVGKVIRPTISVLHLCVHVYR